MTTVALATLGCKVNQFESAALASAFSARDCQLLSWREEADIYVVNTCAVTARAGQESRQLIRAALRKNPQALVVVTGCYAQLEPEKIRAISSRLLLVGNSHKELLVRAALGEKFAGLHSPMAEKRGVFDLNTRNFPGHTRAFLRVQDGCNNFCSYCIVPHTRGRSRSLPAENIFAQAALFAEADYKELVVTGINTGKYGLDLHEKQNIVSLLSGLCTRFPALRFRLSSIEPGEIQEELIALAADRPNFMPHFHIPLQSGDDRILALMRRRYTAADFAAIVTKVHARLPFAAIACDVLCGFPGETEAEAARTRRLLWDLPISALHVFPYSKRPLTPAAAMPGQVEENVKAERARLLRELDRRLRARFYEANQGRTLQVLAERLVPGQPGMLEGFSENYIPLRFAGPPLLTRKITPVRLAAVENGTALGILRPAGPQLGLEPPKGNR